MTLGNSSSSSGSSSEDGDSESSSSECEGEKEKVLTGRDVVPAKDETAALQVKMKDDHFWSPPLHAAILLIFKHAA